MHIIYKIINTEFFIGNEQGSARSSNWVDVDKN